MTSAADPAFEKRFLARYEAAKAFSATLDGPSLAERLARLPDGEVLTILERLSRQERAMLLYAWGFWARPKQVVPSLRHFVMLWLAGRGFGKLLALDTPIPVPSGWTTMGELEEGDVVYDESGRLTTVTGAFAVETPEVCYRLHFSDGTWIDAADTHEWATWTQRERKAFLRSPYEDTAKVPAEWPSWRLRRAVGNPKGRPRIYPDSPGPKVRTTQEIVDTLRYGRRGDLNHSIPVCGALVGRAGPLPLSPYVLGVWLGDGDSRDPYITSADDEVISLIMAEGHLVHRVSSGGSGRAGRFAVDTNPKAGGRLQPDSLRSKLMTVGVLGNKHIPEPYLRADAKARLALLQGLLDTDGSISRASGHVEFCSMNERLARGVVELARSLGQKPVIAESDATLRGRVVGRRWRVTWRPTINVFRLSRKMRKVRASKAQSHRNHHRMIVRVERIPSVPMRCIAVDAPHRMYLAGEGMIPTHNTRPAAEHVRKRIYGGVKSIVMIGPTKGEVLRYMVGGKKGAKGNGSGILDIFPPHERRQIQLKEEKMEIHFHFTGAVAHLVSDEQPELRGGSYELAWLDEICKWRHLGKLWANLEFTMREATAFEPEILVTTTPRPMRFLKELVADEDTITICGRTDENAANLAGRFIQRLDRKFGGSRIGRQERGGELLSDNENALFHTAQIEASRVIEAPRLVRVVVAIDPAIATGDDNDETGIVVMGIDERGHLYVLADASGKFTPEQWGATAVKLYDQWNADAFVGERNRGGDLVAANVRAAVRFAKGQHAVVSIVEVHATRNKHVRAEPVAAMHEQGRLHFVGVLPGVEQEITEWDPTLGGVSPNRLDAMVWGAYELAKLGQEEEVDASAGFVGLTKAAKELAKPSRPLNLAAILGIRGTGRQI